MNTTSRESTLLFSENSVTHFFSSHFQGRLATAGDWNQSLHQLGVGSHQLFEFLAQAEDALGITLENNEIIPDHLQSLGALAALFAQKLAAKTEKKKKKKIIHITSDFLPHISGPQRIISDICKHLESWFDFEVYCFDSDRGLPPSGIIDRIPVRRFGLPRITDVIRLRKRVQRYSGGDNPELAEKACNYNLNSSDIFGAIQSSHAGTLVTHFYHSLLSQYIVEFFPSKRWLFMPEFFKPATGGNPLNPFEWNPHRVDRLLLFQESEWRSAVNAGFPDEKLAWLPFPIDTDEFQPTGDPRDPETLLYVGRLTPNKGIRAFLPVLKSMRAHRSVRLRLVSDIHSVHPLERQELGRIRDTVQQLGLEQSVEFAGAKQGRDLVREYSRHQIHILPSQGECYSMVTLEALACGMSCVNLENRHCGWHHTSVDGLPLVHLSRSIPEMGDQILRLLDQENFVSHRNYINELFSWNRLTREYRKIFEE